LAYFLTLYLNTNVICEFNLNFVFTGYLCFIANLVCIGMRASKYNLCEIVRYVVNLEDVPTLTNYICHKIPTGK
jgi:hypothetical protein